MCHVTFESDGDFEISENAATPPSQQNNESSIDVQVQSDEVEDIDAVSINRCRYSA